MYYKVLLKYNGIILWKRKLLIKLEWTEYIHNKLKQQLSKLGKLIFTAIFPRNL